MAKRGYAGIRLTQNFFAILPRWLPILTRASCRPVHPRRLRVITVCLPSGSARCREPSSVLKLNPLVHHATAFDGQAAENLRVRVQRNGLFLFDFSSWPHALPVHIPGYTQIFGNPVPEGIHEAEIKAEDISVYRARIMNVHQAFMATAEQICLAGSA